MLDRNDVAEIGGKDLLKKSVMASESFKVDCRRENAEMEVVLSGMPRCLETGGRRSELTARKLLTAEESERKAVESVNLRALREKALRDKGNEFMYDNVDWRFSSSVEGLEKMLKPVANKLFGGQVPMGAYNTITGNLVFGAADLDNIRMLRALDAISRTASLKIEEAKLNKNNVVLSAAANLYTGAILNPCGAWIAPRFGGMKKIETRDYVRGMAYDATTFNPDHLRAFYGAENADFFPLYFHSASRFPVSGNEDKIVYPDERNFDLRAWTKENVLPARCGYLCGDLDLTLARAGKKDGKDCIYLSIWEIKKTGSKGTKQELPVAESHFYSMIGLIMELGAGTIEKTSGLPMYPDPEFTRNYLPNYSVPGKVVAGMGSLIWDKDTGKCYMGNDLLPAVQYGSVPPVDASPLVRSFAWGANMLLKTDKKKQDAVERSEDGNADEIRALEKENEKQVYKNFRLYHRKQDVCYGNPFRKIEPLDTYFN